MDLYPCNHEVVAGELRCRLCLSSALLTVSLDYLLGAVRAEIERSPDVLGDQLGAELAAAELLHRVKAKK